jgi:hypothetical protein
VVNGENGENGENGKNGENGEHGEKGKRKRRNGNWRMWQSGDCICDIVNNKKENKTHAMTSAQNLLTLHPQLVLQCLLWQEVVVCLLESMRPKIYIYIYGDTALQVGCEA